MILYASALPWPEAMGVAGPPESRGQLVTLSRGCGGGVVRVGTGADRGAVVRVQTDRDRIAALGPRRGGAVVPVARAGDLPVPADLEDRGDLGSEPRRAQHPEADGVAAVDAEIGGVDVDDGDIALGGLARSASMIWLSPEISLTLCSL